MWRVLIVDDRREREEALKTILEKDKQIEVPYDTVNGKIALQILNEAKNIDLIILNIRMPMMNGMDTMRLIKQNHPNIKIFVRTTFSNEVNKVITPQTEQCDPSLKEVKEVRDKVYKMLDQKSRGGDAVTEKIVPNVPITGTTIHEPIV